MITQNNSAFVENLEQATESELGWVGSRSEEEWSFWIHFNRNGERDDKDGM
jgi:hypothetical protein